MAKPPMIASLAWTRDLEFEATSGSQTLTIDGKSSAGPSPVQTLAFSIAGCMGMDVVEILRKGRHPISGLDIAFHADRADTPPHRFTNVKMTFVVHGDVPREAVQRAIALSHEKYCSVSNSLRGDISISLEFDVRP